MENNETPEPPIYITPGETFDFFAFAKFTDGTLPDLTTATAITACFKTTGANLELTLGSGVSVPGSPTNKIRVQGTAAQSANFHSSKTQGVDLKFTGSWGTKISVKKNIIVLDKNCP